MEPFNRRRERSGGLGLRVAKIFFVVERSLYCRVVEVTAGPLDDVDLARLRPVVLRPQHPDGRPRTLLGRQLCPNLDIAIRRDIPAFSSETRRRDARRERHNRSVYHPIRCIGGGIVGLGNDMKASVLDPDIVWIRGVVLLLAVAPSRDTFFRSVAQVVLPYCGVWRRFPRYIKGVLEYQRIARWYGVTRRRRTSTNKPDIVDVVTPSIRPSHTEVKEDIQLVVSLCSVERRGAAHRIGKVEPHGFPSGEFRDALGFNRDRRIGRVFDLDPHLGASRGGVHGSGHHGSRCKGNRRYGSGIPR